jgi:hypothetical protein
MQQPWHLSSSTVDTILHTWPLLASTGACMPLLCCCLRGHHDAPCQLHSSSLCPPSALPLPSLCPPSALPLPSLCPPSGSCHVLDHWLLDHWLLDHWLLDHWLLDHWLLDHWLLDHWLLNLQCGSTQQLIQGRLRHLHSGAMSSAAARAATFCILAPAAGLQRTRTRAP